MGRHQKFTDREALAVLLKTTAALHRRPSGHELARALGVSSRTAWRYLTRLTREKECPRCHGRGWVKAEAR